MVLHKHREVYRGYIHFIPAQQTWCIFCIMVITGINFANELHNFANTFFFFQHCLVTVNQTNSGWRNCYACRCMKRLYSIWHKQSSELAHTTFSKTIWAFGGCFSALKPRHSFQQVILLSTLRLVLSSISGICPCGQNFQPFLPPSCKFCYIFIFCHKWDIFISPLTNHTVKGNWKIKAVSSANVWTEPEREEWKSINWYERQVQQRKCILSPSSSCVTL